MKTVQPVVFFSNRSNTHLKHVITLSQKMGMLGRVVLVSATMYQHTGDIISAVMAYWQWHRHTR